MKLLIYSILALLLVTGSLLLVLSIASRKQPELGLQNGQLRACPATPNCVCSVWPGDSYIEPITYSIAHADAWQGIKQAIRDSGGVIVTEQANYLHATYTTPLLRFIDDVELQQDEDRFLINIRSASRVGHSDLGTNRGRLEKLRKLFEQSY